MIVVEVLSPSTRHIDASKKLAGYFRLPSVAHYLIVDPTSGSFCTTRPGPMTPSPIVREAIALDPRVRLKLGEVYGGCEE